MYNFDRDALLCDLAETYNIYDIKALPLSKVALFSVGLRDNSRIKLKLNNQRVDLQTLILASMVDRLSYLLWIETEDGRKGKNRPTSIVDTLTKEQINESDIERFTTPEAFEQRRQELLKGVK